MRKTKYRVSLELLKQRLTKEDIAYIAKTCGYTTQTVRTAFKANFPCDHTDAHRAIVALAVEILDKREHENQLLAQKVMDVAKK